MKKISFQKVNRRKGAAIELAVTLLVVTFSLSTLILTTTFLVHRRQMVAEEEIKNQIVFEQIGEDFIKAVKTGSGTAWTNNYPDYDINVSNLKLSVKEAGEDEILFDAELKDNGDGTYSIIKWN